MYTTSVSQKNEISKGALFVLIFIQGFASLGAEIVALRQLTPYMGSSILVTAPTIGLYLLALALGYYFGGKKDVSFKKIGAYFWISAVLVGLGLSAEAVKIYQTFSDSINLGFYTTLAVLMIVGYLLSYTFPSLIARINQVSPHSTGVSLFWSTLGSVMGCMAISLVMMQIIGVWSAVLAVSGSLLFGLILLKTKKTFFKIAVSAPLIFLPLKHDFEKIQTAYADYRVITEYKDTPREREVFLSNNHRASTRSTGEPKTYSRVVNHVRNIILNELNFKNKKILVLGAGGFTISDREDLNQYTHVDIDPKIKETAEKIFLKDSIKGEFVAADAREFIRKQNSTYDLIFVDVVNSRNYVIPPSLSTVEFWHDVKKVTSEKGYVIINLFLDQNLKSEYAKNILATVFSVMGWCEVDVLRNPLVRTNAVLVCAVSGENASLNENEIYLDSKNSVETDETR